MDNKEKEINENIKYLKLLSQRYNTIQSVSTEIINLQSILDLPKGTEHFLSDIHGEYEAFLHILNNASGVIREKIDMLFAHTVSNSERSQLASLIYYPQRRLERIKKDITNDDLCDWYKIALHRLIEICRLVASKYTRSKVRKALPKDFEYIIDELLHTNYDVQNKEMYYDKIISTIIDIDRADEFIIALSNLIKRLCVDKLHIIGDIFDRGPRADIILDSLLSHHCVDVQWGNHDILWMGAAAGSAACIANVLNVSLQYNNLDVIESGYNINLRQLSTFAYETYGECPDFAPKNIDKKDLKNKDITLIAKIHKAICIIQFKLEGQIILRNPNFDMQDRLLLSNIDYNNGTINLDGTTYKLKDCDLPTVDPNSPYDLTPEEQKLIDILITNFKQSEKLQKHIRFLYSNGGMYKCINSNLLYHGCIPLNEDGSFTTVEIDGKKLSGKSLMDYAEALARKAYFSQDDQLDKLKFLDFMWYLWCGRNSPLYGRNKMTTFERYFIEDASTHIEYKNTYYSYLDDINIVENILKEFGLNNKDSHIMNGHVPVRTKDGESPIKANGKLIVIDGGFCKAYQPTTGIAGYTLIFNSYGLRLISHKLYDTVAKAIEENTDIQSTSTVFETVDVRKKVADTDEGKNIINTISDLKLLLSAYRLGIIKENI